MIQHLEVLEALIGKKRWLIDLLAKFGVQTSIESWFREDQFGARCFSCQSANRSGYYISIDLVDQLEPMSKEIDHDHSLVGLYVNFPYEDGSGDSGAWLRLLFYLEKEVNAYIELDRDGYKPDSEQEAAFAMFPNGKKTEEEAIAFIEAATKYYLAKPVD